MEKKLNDFIEKILAHPNNDYCKNCAFKCEKKEMYYPRFAYGNVDSKIMLVFQNPGRPSEKRLPEIAKKTWEAINYEGMLKEASTGVTNWLFNENKKFDEDNFTIEGKKGFLDSFYITQSYRCPDLEDKAKSDKLRKSVLETCKNVLVDELEIVKPKYIITFGTQARKSILEIYGIKLNKNSIPLKKNFKEFNTTYQNDKSPIIISCPHPDSLWRNPPINEAAFQKIFKETLNKNGIKLKK